MFLNLDTNGDGCLDFWEIMTFYYMVKTRFVCCKRCGYLLGLYFTCINCFDDSQPYNVCSLYYSIHDIDHHHHYFMDSYVLCFLYRRYKLGSIFIFFLSCLGVIQAQNNNYSTWMLNFFFMITCIFLYVIKLRNYGFQALELALSLGNFVGFGCNIM
ncbi:hypothetical protein UlMin_010091 [Ulmus minor]